jgi:hypothetical protein
MVSTTSAEVLQRSQRSLTPENHFSEQTASAYYNCSVRRKTPEKRCPRGKPESQETIFEEWYVDNVQTRVSMHTLFRRAAKKSANVKEID